MRNQDELSTSFYAVTAAHVVSDASIIVLNTRDGASRPIEFEPTDWASALPSEDVAAVDITDRLRNEDDAFSHVPIELFATYEFIWRTQVGVGEDGFMLGLFTEQPGTVRNLIAARFGNVSLMADDTAPIRRETSPGSGVYITSPCHVFDIHSRPGFSGSPVFIYRTPDSDLRDTQYGFRDTRHRFNVSLSSIESQIRSAKGRSSQTFEIVQKIDYASKFMALLGIHVAQYYDAVKVKSDTPKHSEDAQEAVRDGDKIRVPGSMTIIVPAAEILRLLERNTQLAAQREERNARDKAAERSSSKRGVIVGESAEVPTVPKADNQAHKEDFTALLSEAAQSPAKGD